jgi:hypothetical protein
MRRVAAQAQARTRKPHGPFPVQQPVPPIGGFPSVKRTAYLRGMARSAGLLKGDPSPNVKLQAPKKTPRRPNAKGLAKFAQSASPRMLGGGASLTRGRGLGAR